MIFGKVTFEQYCKDCGYTAKLGDDLIEGVRKEYDDIPLPAKGTPNSAGYDFTIPFDIDLEPNESIIVPTGINWIVKTPYLERCVLKIYPRSSMGIRRGLALLNTVAIIDSDYWKADNNGHIMMALVNRGKERLHIDKGERFVQGIISSYLTVANTVVLSEKRTGGIGSTSK